MGVSLEAQRAHAAGMAERFALALLDGHDCAEDLRLWSLQREALDRQIAWVGRRTAWAVPATPAWCD